MDNVVQIARQFAAILDQREYQRLSAVLSENCQYCWRGKLIRGANAIIDAYRKNTEWAFRVFDRIEFMSDVRPLSEDSARICFTDRIHSTNEVHAFHCEQVVTCDDQNQIIRIVQVDLEGEQAALEAFLSRCGVKRPQ